MGIGGDDSWSPSVSCNSSLAPVATITSCSGVKNNNRQAMSARISRKEIHYVLFKKHKLLDVRFILFLLLFYHEAYFPFFPIWLHDINHISKSDTGLFLPLFLCSRYYQPLFGLLSDNLGLRKYLLLITG